MPNYINFISETLVTRAHLARVAAHSSNFVHVSIRDMLSVFDGLYDNPVIEPCFLDPLEDKDGRPTLYNTTYGDDSGWAVHRALLLAEKAGYLKTRLYNSAYTIDVMCNVLGQLCPLCFNVHHGSSFSGDYCSAINARNFYIHYISPRCLTCSDTWDQSPHPHHIIDPICKDCHADIGDGYRMRRLRNQIKKHGVSSVMDMEIIKLIANKSFCTRANSSGRAKRPIRFDPRRSSLLRDPSRAWF